MPIRARTRYPGDIDPALGQTTSMIYLPYWVSGRYYEACISPAVAPTAASLSGTNWLTTPFIVPNVVTITAIGVEVTSAATAGNTMRLAIYDSDPITGWPTTRKLDSGQIAIDATGFQSATISLVLHPGLYWSSHVASSTATYRAYNTTTLIQFLPIVDYVTISAIYSTGLLNAAAGASFNSIGYPNNFVLVGTNSSQTYGQSGLIVPRILLGV